MPKYEGLDPVTPPSDGGGSNVPSVVPPPSNMGAPDASSSAFTPQSSPGPRGKARWDAAQADAPGIFSDPLEYERWLGALPNDPSDTEYQAALDDARQSFAKWKRVLYPMGFPSEVVSNLALSSADKRLATKQSGPVRNDAQIRAGEIPPPSPAGAGGVYRANEKAEYRREWTQPTFKGAKISDDEIFQEALGGEDPFLAQFRSDEGIQLTGGNRSLALRSGVYVYMGTEHSNELDADRDVYYYVEDASNALADLPAEVLSGYQKQLGDPITGKIDAHLASLWGKAVQAASMYAARGFKVTVRELMDLYVAGAAGGGAGGSGAGANLEDIDYYRAMMAVLGDISGVGNA